jgi:hypothetical protein
MYVSNVIISLLYDFSTLQLQPIIERLEIFKELFLKANQNDEDKYAEMMEHLVISIKMLKSEM